MVAQTYDLAHRMDAPRAIALCRCFGGFLDFQRGRWGRAESALREAVGIYRKIGGASGEALSLQRLAVLLTARGDLDAAMAALDEGVFAAERAIMRSHCLIRLYASLARNRLAAAEVASASEFIEAGIQAARRHGYCLTCNALLLPEAVRVSLATGRQAQAHEEARRLEEIAARFGSPAWIAMAGHARARVLSVAGEWEPAYVLLGRAREAFLTVGAVYEGARCLAGQAQALEAGGDPGQAAALRAQAMSDFRAVGAAGIET